MEYKDVANQRAVGYEGCDSVIDTITGCGNDTTDIEVVEPLEIPSGDIELDDTGTLAIDEGSTGTFTVKLGATPTPSSNVTVTITSADTAAVSVSPATLTFTPANRETAQTVTVTGVEDDNDGDNESVVLTVSATAGGLIADDVTKTVTVDDNEPTPTIVLSGGSAALEIEEGESDTFTVKIDPPSTRSVEITLTSDDSDVTLDKTTLTFAANATAAQTVTVNVAEDNDNINESVTITLDADGITVADAVKMIAVQDTPSGALVLDSTATLSIDEGGTGTFAVRLDTLPSENVTVNITSEDTNAVTVNPATLTFTASNYSTAQPVTVSGVHDSDITDEPSVDITLSVDQDIGIVAGDVEKRVAVNDDDSPGTLFMLPSPLQVVEGGQEIFLVRLGTVPTVERVVVSLTLTGNNPSVSLSPASLTFTDADWNTNQVVTVSVEEDTNADDGSDTITGAFTNGTGNYASAAGPSGATIPLVTLDRPGDIVTSTQMVDLLEGGDAVEFTVRLGEVPINTNTVTLTLTNSNRDVTITPKVLLFTRDNWSEERTVSARAGEDSDKEDGYDIIVIKGAGGNYSRSESRVSVSVEENDDDGGVIGGTPGRSGVYALAIPPETGSDSSDIRIRCKQSSPCAVYFDCTSQDDGGLFQGWLPELIPAWGTRTVGASDIVRLTGDSWFGKGRLGCLLRSKERIGAQVWTRSGDGVLVNNSALLTSVLDSGSGKRRADIESIPSPDGDEQTNLRIRCLAPEGEHCTRSLFSCYTDDGTMHNGNLGRIDRLTVRHLQTSELASLIDHRWQGMGLSCELHSDHHFTVQVMTRTGGGGALVNNSATGVSEN